MNEEDSQKILASDCRLCSRRTRHEVLHKEVEEVNQEWMHEKDTWQILRCLGCLTFSFSHIKEDFDNVEEDEKGNVGRVLDFV